MSDRINLYTLVSMTKDPLPAYQAGAHIDLDLEDAGTRSYSLVDFLPHAEVPADYKIAVQREDEGQGGSLAVHALKSGDKVTSSDPKNDFKLRDTDALSLLIAGGIGVTPVISFATALKAQGRAFDFHFAVRNRGVMPFAGQLETLFGEQLKVWYDDQEMIKLDELIRNATPDTQIYCCGPKGMIEAVRESAEAAGLSKDHVHFELFATPATHEGDQPFEVEIADGRVFTVPADKTIVETLEENGVDVMYDCARGDCGICQTDVISGSPDHRDVVLSDAERASGKIMQICVSRAKSARLVLDL